MKKFLSLVAVMAMMTGCSTFSQDCGSNAFGDSSVNTVYFDYDSSVLREDSIATLEKQVEEIKNSNTEVVVAGHADERGTTEYNLALGERRANAVKEFFVVNGISESMISTISYGKERPAVEGHNEAAWAKNRRAVTDLK